MPSRLALGSSTKASARFEALLRVIVRLSSMNGASELLRGLLRGGRGFVRPARWQSAGFTQGRVARGVVRMIAAAAAAAAAAGEKSGGLFPVSGPDPGAGEGTGALAASFADEIGPEEEDQGDTQGGADNDEGVVESKGGFVRIFGQDFI